MYDFIKPPMSRSLFATVCFLLATGSTYSDALPNVETSQLENLQLLLDSADSGDANSQYRLAQKFRYGVGVDADPVQTLNYYRAAAQQGMAEAQYELASILDGDLLDVGRDRSEAFIWFQAAADQGHVQAQIKIGSGHRHGDGLQQSYADAAHWFIAAAEQGSSFAALNAAEVLADDLSDYGSALRWYEFAAINGRRAGQLALGDLYRDGKGVSQDLVSAHMWYGIAAGYGSGTAEQKRDQIELDMTQDQIALATENGRVCLSSDFNSSVCGLQYEQSR